MEKTMVRQAVPLQPMEDDGGADIHLQPMEDPMLEQVDAPKGGCDLMGSMEQAAGRTCGKRQRSPRWSRFAGRTCDPVGDPQWSGLFLKDCTPWKGPMLEQLVKKFSLWEGLMLEKLVEDCLLREGPHAAPGEEREEEGAAETMCDELPTTPTPHPLCHWRGGGRETGIEVKPRMKGGMEGRHFKIWVYFSLLYSDLIGNK
ncbi:AN1-type zinc finger protein 5-like [Grus japonensis]|uniref:AN1-type zinc finger protein 5-like n=1 Tax=Grus japonensis TaxID=30415 RepID=A0ABC9WCT9_GRUJA